MEERRRTLIARLERLGDCGLLDEDVHDAKAEEAATINNGGYAAQLDYLDLDFVETRIEEAEAARMRRSERPRVGGHAWTTRGAKLPSKCPSCKSRQWNKPRSRPRRSEKEELT
jgi:predicted Zn-ribbon and HTH transcriptional regulator